MQHEYIKHEYIQYYCSVVYSKTLVEFRLIQYPDQCLTLAVVMIFSFLPVLCKWHWLCTQIDISDIQVLLCVAGLPLQRSAMIPIR